MISLFISILPIHSLRANHFLPSTLLRTIRVQQSAAHDPRTIGICGVAACCPFAIPATPTGITTHAVTRIHMTLAGTRIQVVGYCLPDSSHLQTKYWISTT